MVMVIVCACLGIATVLASVAWFVTRRTQLALTRRFSTIVDADAEAARIVDVAKQKIVDADREAARIVEVARRKLVEAELDAARLLAEAQRTLAQTRSETTAEARKTATLAGEYAAAKVTFDRLFAAVRSLEENLEDISFGLYRPHYSFDTPEDFKEELEKTRDQQKAMIGAHQAATFAVAWTVAGSEREGAKMQKQYAKLLLRAFNGECDAAMAKVSWNNADKMVERITKAWEALNQLGSVMTVSISSRFRELKLAELRLEHELEEKKRAIAEEQRRIREQMREEEKAQREAEKAQTDAEAEEARFEKAFEKARVELAKAKGAEHQRLSSKLVELEAQLAEAQRKTQRAKSLAQLTKAGHVYVLSNIGSFGEGVFKIGMTRRQEPMDRVKELGDASVPFPFDVHGMVYSEDAPGLECALHQAFARCSVNLVNMKKEFFRVELDEVQRLVRERGLAMSITKLAEAREYRETVQILRSQANEPAQTKRKHPDALVALQ